MRIAILATIGCVIALGVVSVALVIFALRAKSEDDVRNDVLAKFTLGMTAAEIQTQCADEGYQCGPAFPWSGALADADIPAGSHVITLVTNINLEPWWKVTWKQLVFYMVLDSQQRVVDIKEVVRYSSAG